MRPANSAGKVFVLLQKMANCFIATTDEYCVGSVIGTLENVMHTVATNSLFLVGEYSSYPKFNCPVCGNDLWTEQSERTNGQEWLFTQKGIRHYKSKCNLSGVTNGSH